MGSIRNVGNGGSALKPGSASTSATAKDLNDIETIITAALPWRKVRAVYQGKRAPSLPIPIPQALNCC